MRILFDHDPLTGDTTYFEGDGQGGFALHHHSDVESIIEQNKRLFNNGHNGWVTKAKEFKHVAEIPNAIALKWLIEDGIDVNKKDHWPAVKRKLNSSEYLFLRTSPGRI